VKKFSEFLRIANFFHRDDDSNGNITTPTVLHAKIKAVTAKRLTQLFNNSPPVT